MDAARKRLAVSGTIMLLTIGASAAPVVLAGPAGGVSGGRGEAVVQQAVAELPTHRELRLRTPVAEPDRARAGRGTTIGGGRPARAGLPLPGNRIVGLYGAPQLEKTIIGRSTTEKARRRLKALSRRFQGPGRRPVIRSIDLVATIATASPGSSGKYRFRQPDQVIRTYLRLARRVGGRLMLDVQPGRSSFLAEVRHLRPWLVKRRVDLVLDPEWVTRPDEVPGERIGSVGARQLNRISLILERLARKQGAGRKVLAVHHFTRSGIRREGRIIERRHVRIAPSYTGFGSAAAKRSGYEGLARPDLFNGISIGLKLDDPPLSPGQVLSLGPRPDLILYQ